MDSRRDVLKKVGIVVVAGGVVGLGGLLGEGPTSVVASASRAEAPWALLSPLVVGDELPLGWRIGELTPIRFGATILRLDSNSGDEARIHICLRSGDSVGIASTERLDLRLMDGGEGDKDSAADLGRLVLGIAEHMRGNEARAFADHPSLAELMTHPERERQYRDQGAALS